MAQKMNRGLVWVGLVLLLLLVAWLGMQYHWGPWKQNGSGTNYGMSPSPSASPKTNSSLNDFYSNTQAGESKQQVSSRSQADHLSQNCTVTINSSQVCVYTSASASGMVTITFRNGKVAAFTKFGF